MLPFVDLRILTPVSIRDGVGRGEVRGTNCCLMRCREGMTQKASLTTVQELMAGFADMTGLSAVGEASRRYLWTDAFAVCNFLELYRQTVDDKYKNLALLLVDQVHEILGRHREDDTRSGWISGLDDQEGGMHPTRGGLRIGKKMNERQPDDPYDEDLEWDRDGQYYHYLTKWMHALNRVSRTTGKATYNVWAIELAKAAHAGFTCMPPLSGHKRMFWKMSIDLSRPLVASMGQHDPLEGLITYCQLQATAARHSERPGPDLNREIADMADICTGKEWATDDSLGIGSLLWDAYKVGQMVVSGDFEEIDLLDTLLESCVAGLASCRRMNPFNLPPDYRLAFRELGLSIGMHALERLYGLVEKNGYLFRKRHPLHTKIRILRSYLRFSELIETFWLDPTQRETKSWREHEDINMVMLATSLAPDGFLTL